jgi:hypothetical protein
VGGRLDDATALAIREASPRAIARYLASLKPALGSATDARNVWVRYLSELAHREDLAAAHTEAVQLALARGQQFHDARRAIAQLPVPPGYEPMQQAVDGWLQALLASCEVIVRASPPIGRATLDRAQAILREAATKADRFNQQRTAAVQALTDAQMPVPARAKRIVASKKEMRALIVSLVAALLLCGGAIFAVSSVSSGPPARTPTPVRPGQPGSGIDRRVFPQPDVLARLRQEIASRKVAWQDPDVQLIPPDRIVVKGKIQGPTSVVPVEVELQMSVTPDGKPRLEAKRLSAIGVDVPAGAFDALNKRVDEANQMLPQQLSPGQVLTRLYVQDNAIIAELTGGPNAPPAAGTPTGGSSQAGG